MPLGVLLIVGGQLGLGRLSGDLRFGKGNVRVFVPLATSLVLSAILPLVVNLLLRR